MNLDFIYYPVSFILWCWHWVFGLVLGDSTTGNAISWTLSIVFLVFTLRLILLRPAVQQVRAMRKMQKFQPEIKKLQKKYAGDKQRLAHNAALARSIKHRFPYIDPLHHLQVELVRRWRAGQGDERVQTGIHISINGIAAGLRNTG